MLLNHLIVSEGDDGPTSMHSLVPAVLRCARMLMMQLVLYRGQAHIIGIALNEVVDLHLKHSLPLPIRHIRNQAPRLIHPVPIRASLRPKLQSCTICPNLFVEFRADAPIYIVQVLMGQSNLSDRAIRVEVGVVEKGTAHGFVCVCSAVI